MEGPAIRWMSRAGGEQRVSCRAWGPGTPVHVDVMILKCTDGVTVAEEYDCPACERWPGFGVVRVVDLAGILSESGAAERFRLSSVRCRACDFAATTSGFGARSHFDDSCIYVESFTELL